VVADALFAAKKVSSNTKAGMSKPDVKTNRFMLFLLSAFFSLTQDTRGARTAATGLTSSIYTSPKYSALHLTRSTSRSCLRNSQVSSHTSATGMPSFF
jgi:hypothetical protein